MPATPPGPIPRSTTCWQQIAQAVDFDEREKLYEDLQVYMQENPPFIYLYEPMAFEAINTRVQDYTPRVVRDSTT